MSYIFDNGFHTYFGVAVSCNNNAEKELKERCYKALDEMKINNNESIVRLEKELEFINEEGISEFFIKVFDLVNEIKKKRIYYFCNGSSTGSLVNYLLGITVINPIEYDLLFERFVISDYKKYPIIDMNILEKDKEKLIECIDNIFNGYDRKIKDDNFFHDDCCKVGFLSYKESDLKRMYSFLEVYKDYPFKDIVNIYSLHRPGVTPTINQYISTFKHEMFVGRDELFENIVKETFNWFIYQEQYIQAFSLLYGIDLSEATRLFYRFRNFKNEDYNDLLHEWILKALENGIAEIDAHRYTAMFINRAITAVPLKSHFLSLVYELVKINN